MVPTGLDVEFNVWEEEEAGDPMANFIFTHSSPLSYTHTPGNNDVDDRTFQICDCRKRFGLTW